MRVKKQTTVSVISAIFIFLFLYTGVSKLMAPDYFRAPVAQSALLAKYTDIIVWLVPSIEILTAASLMFNHTRHIGLFCSLLLMTAFTLYVAYMLTFQKNLPCSCGGVIQKLSWPKHLILNFVLTILAYAGWRLSVITSGLYNIHLINPIKTVFK